MTRWIVAVYVGRGPLPSVWNGAPREDFEQVTAIGWPPLGWDTREEAQAQLGNDPTLLPFPTETIDTSGPIAKAVL